MKITEITKCRICGNPHLIPLMDLGEQPLSGIFPEINEADPPSAPLVLVKCDNSGKGSNACGLVQLKHSCDPGEMFKGGDYGYRSGLNQTMTDHLNSMVNTIETRVKLISGDIVIDIGSNDGTLLKSYYTNQLGKQILRIGIDPGGEQYRKYYPSDISLIADFFPTDQYTKRYGDKKAKVITSIAMFYDLEDPMAFVKNIKDTLHEDGLWVLEQSYLPTMLKNNSFDTICHEHLEYYALAQIEWMATRNNLKIIDVELNYINGGSFKVYVAHNHSKYIVQESVLELRDKESALNLNTIQPFIDFNIRVDQIKTKLTDFIRTEIESGKKIFLYGASTKGNVLLNHFGINSDMILAAADRNPEKWTCKTPGSHIPIISEESARKMNPDYFLVLPWHFKKEFLVREQEFLNDGGGFIFPLPYVEIVGSQKHGK